MRMWKSMATLSYPIRIARITHRSWPIKSLVCWATGPSNKLSRKNPCFVNIWFTLVITLERPCLILKGATPTDHLRHLMTKPTKWHVRPAKTQISLGIRLVWSESSLSAWRKLESLATHWGLSAQRRLWSDWMDAQADLSLCWAHSHSVGFVMR